MSGVDEMSWRQQSGDKSVSLYLFVTMKVSIMRSEFEALDLVNPRNPSTSRTESENDVAIQTTHGTMDPSLGPQLLYQLVTMECECETIRRFKSDGICELEAPRRDQIL